MTITRFVGDVHGHIQELKILLEKTPNDVLSVVQVGDLGVGFSHDKNWDKNTNELLASNGARFIRGNHDSPDGCKAMSSWIPDGRVEDSVMYVGGAWSIDHAFRTPGISWWEDEELSTKRLYDLIDSYKHVKPRVMVTHDFPNSAARSMFFKNPNHMVFGKYQHRTRTAAALEAMLDEHAPELWIGGHWHHNVDMTIGDTRFICLDELSWCDVDMKTLEVTKGQ